MSICPTCGQHRRENMGGILWDPRTGTLSIAGEVVRLTRIEAEVLDALHRADGAAISRDGLVAIVYQDRRLGKAESLATVICRMRRKLDRVGVRITKVRPNTDGYRLLLPGEGCTDGR